MNKVNNSLMVFKGNNVEAFNLNGKVLFNAKHVANILGIKNVNDNITKMNEKQVIKLTNSIIGKTDFRKLHNTGENFLTESGVYKLIMRSDKPDAEEFQDWVTDEVLPQIRQTNGYIPIKEEDDDLTIMAKAMQILQNTIAKKDDLLAIQQPKVEAFDMLMDSRGNIDFAEFVKSAKLKVGRNKFMNHLRCNNILRENTQPYQSYIDSKYFEVILTVKNNVSYAKTLITKKGCKWLSKKCAEWELVSE